MHPRDFSVKPILRKILWNWFHGKIVIYWLNNSISFKVQEGILRVHPDLAGALAEAGQLTSERYLSLFWFCQLFVYFDWVCLHFSTKEQSHANLNLMTPEEKSKMAHLNKRYKEKFGFPFVICARLNKKDAILQGLEQRYFNDLEQELKIGIDNVMKICELRVRDLVQVAQQKEPSRL